jgi:hypothetical protein
MRNPAGSSAAATSATLPARFEKCVGLNSAQHHQVHFSDTTHSQSARRISTIPVRHQMKPALFEARYSYPLFISGPGAGQR